MDGVITPTNNTLTDMPIKLAGTSSKGSWFNHGGSANMAINAATALEVSSNSYMMQLLMKEAGMKIYTKRANYDEAKYFATKRGVTSTCFGLGLKLESTCLEKQAVIQDHLTKKHIGSALDLSYGNYDGYTLIQLAQYMSTIANGGNRMRPYIVKEIRGTKANGQLGAVEYTTKSPKFN